MKIAFLLKEGMLELTAKVLVETALKDAEITSLEEAEHCFVFNKSFETVDFCKYICVLKEDNPKDFLSRVINVLKQQFSKEELIYRISNLEWFAKSYSKIDSADLISDVVLSYRSMNVDLLDMSRDEVITLLKKNVKFTQEVDEMLGVKLHLYANHNKVDSYYRWLKYKFGTLYLHNKYKCGQRFFTASEVESFYRSLASKIRYITKVLDTSTADVIDRYNEELGYFERIYLFDVSSINRALNEVILKAEDNSDLIVCCKSNNVALYSFLKDGEIIHNVITNRNKVDRVVEFIEPLKP